MYAVLETLYWAAGVYVAYRLIRTAVALVAAVFFYRVLPLFYVPSLNRFKGRWTVVSGSTDGIGKAYTIELARRGLRKFILIGRNQLKLNDVQSYLEAKFGARVQTLLFDFYDGDYEALRHYIDEFDIGFVVNSVGVGRELMERYGENPKADQSILRVNGLGSAEFMSAVLPTMERHGGGQMVVISSVLGYQPHPFLAAYCAAKTLISFLCESIDYEYPTIDVQCLTPCVVASKMTFYETGSLFIPTPDELAKEAINTIGILKKTTGTFNHEIQMLLRHLLPWPLLKQFMVIVLLYQKQRALHLSIARGGGEIKEKQIPEVTHQRSNA